MDIYDSKRKAIFNIYTGPRPVKLELSLQNVTVLQNSLIMLRADTACQLQNSLKNKKNILSNDILR